MKSITTKILLFVFSLGFFASCNKASCPAYSQEGKAAKGKPAIMASR